MKMEENYYIIFFKKMHFHLSFINIIHNSYTVFDNKSLKTFPHFL